MAIMQSPFTRADYDRLPEGFPAQLIEGELVREPAPTYGHQDTVVRLVEILLPLVERGMLITAPTDVAIDEHNVFQPDIVVLRSRPPRDSSYVGTPRLAIEVLSPRTATRDRTIKTKRLIEIGVEEVWLVDPQSETVEVHTSSDTRRAEGDQALSSGEVDGFSLVPVKLFR